MALLAELKQRAHQLKAETSALYLAARDPRVKRGQATFYIPNVRSTCDEGAMEK